MLFLLCFGIIMIIRSDKLKKDEKYRYSIIHSNGNELNENGELFTGFRKYKTAEGYIRHEYAISIAWTIFAFLYIIILLSEYILHFYILFKPAMFLAAMLLTDLLLYIRHKNI